MEGYDSSKYEKMSVATDLLVFTVEDDKLKILLVERSEEPFKNAFVQFLYFLIDWYK